jgi:hypothetical protein
MLSHVSSLADGDVEKRRGGESTHRREMRGGILR